AAAGGHGGGSAAAQTDQHGRAAKHDQLGTHRDIGLFDVLGADVAHATGDHDRLVVATDFRATGRLHGLLEGTEVAGQVGTAEFVVERGAAQRAVDHDLQRSNDATRLAVILFPGLLEAGDAQVGYGKAGQARLGLAATTGRTPVADLAAGAGGGTGERGDGGRVVVGLDLHQDVNRLLMSTVFTSARLGEEATGDKALDDRGVVLVRGQYAFAVHLVGVLDHAEQALFLSLAVDVPAGVEDLVPAVFGVGLGEHHQFDVAGVAAQSLEAFHQVVDLVVDLGLALADDEIDYLVESFQGLGRNQGCPPG